MPMLRRQQLLHERQLQRHCRLQDRGDLLAGRHDDERSADRRLPAEADHHPSGLQDYGDEDLVRRQRESRDDSVQVQLKQDGEDYANGSATLNAAGNWTHEFTVPGRP